MGADVILGGGLRGRLLGAGDGERKSKNGQSGEEKAAQIGHRVPESPEQPDYSPKA